MQDRAAKTCRRLIRSAAEVFDRNGFTGSSVGRICAVAQVSHGAMHFHFRSKQALGEAVESCAAEILRGVTGPVPDRHPAPLQLLVDVSHALARRLSDDSVLRAGFGLARDPAWTNGECLWQHWREWVRGLLDLAGREDQLAPGVDLDDAALAITAVMAGLEELRRRPVRPSEQTVTPFWRLVLPQLAAEGIRDRLAPEGGPPSGDEGRSRDERGSDAPGASEGAPRRPRRGCGVG
ncbi:MULTISPECIES: ScbR family autoregulator-binding transcription factor [Streptomyces]|uniref:A-factor receptor protein n=1 Tax=Streptomyces rubrolavendulae TaxID=285473 RepID=A0A1D8GAN7_9ACTN|nr:ScbR family autoregulator-binding transcription factor [Streptomyces rubrolavendulae]AOT62527.1 A-factor receptor protein [Streptomyces rubrolavendulae]